MSRTLFWYIFKDLLRIFFLTSCALAGIMSFGGLLRPLTEHGLNAGQAARMLTYFMPAMTTYSLPVAALFATTVVYGRLAADNEITAMRAAGIAYHPLGGIATPAMVLGLTVALISLLFLCFIVPVATLKVEQVIYSNLARLIANEIERQHYIRFEGTTIFAQEAAVAEDDPRHPDEQMVRLGGLMIIAYEKPDPRVPRAEVMYVPREFYLAKEAMVFIRRNSSGDFTIEAKLVDPGGVSFPRTFIGTKATQGGVRETQYGPMGIESLIREQTKFMDIRRLHELAVDLGKSRRVQGEVGKIVRVAQEEQFLSRVADKLAVKEGGTFHFDAGGEQYDLESRAGAQLGMRGGRLVIAPGRLIQVRNGKADFTWDATEIELSATPVGDDSMAVKVLLRDVTAQTPEGPTQRLDFTRQFSTPLPPDLKGLEDHDVDYYRMLPDIRADQKAPLERELIRVGNGVQSELHSRCSFALSCLILVIVGCCLGMMFKSGNFLTAFALSVIPALVCIALIVAGQHTCENVPYKLDNFQNPLHFGLAMIWSGNAVVLALAVALGWRLQRQ